MARKRFSSPSSVLLIALACAGCASHGNVLDKVDSYRREGNYFLAYQTIARARQAEPGNDVFEKAYWKARIDYLVDRGQELIFLEDMLGAIGELEAGRRGTQRAVDQ